MPSPTHPSPSRRAVLAGVAGAAGFAGAATRPARGAPARATVATWNTYLGVDLFDLFDARSIEDVRTIAGELLADARRHPYAARADAIADGIVTADADAVALQEAARLRALPSDATDATVAGAGETVADLRDLVVAALADRGRPYEVAAETVTTDVRLPADTADGRVDVHLTDRVALLVREGVAVRDSRSGRYDAEMTFPVLGTDRTVTLRRGYCVADLAVGGAPVTVGSTHLESASSSVRRRQAGELLDALPDDGPVVVGADLNSGPGGTSAAYDTVTAELTDAHAAVKSGEPGDTCCQPSGLRNDRSRLSKRVDAVLSTGAAEPRAVERLGEASADRIEATVDGETVTVWPSDHAGVAATVALPTGTATPVPTARTTGTEGPNGTRTGTAPPAGTAQSGPTASGTESDADAATTSSSGAAETTDGTGSGFGFLGAVAALVGGALVRDRGED